MEMVNFDKADLDIDNLNSLLRMYDFNKNENLILDIDILNESGIDLVVYDTTEMLQQPGSVEDFHTIITENGLDEEEFEVDRWTLVRSNS